MSIRLSSIAKRLRSSITASRLVAVFETGIFKRFLELADTGFISEIAAKIFGKSRADSASTSDAEIKTFGKNPSDAPQVIENANFAIGKNESDSANTSDDEQRDFGKFLSNSAGIVADRPSFDQVKPESDSASVLDSPIKNTGKTIADDSPVTDKDTIQFGKVESDSAALSDDQTLAVTKSIIDSANATDDFDGTATPLDDQEIQFGKRITQSFAVSEEFTRQVQYQRELENSFATIDVPKITLTKSIADVVNAAEQLTLPRAKIVGDSPDIVEQHKITMIKVLSDGYEITDLPILQFTANREDSGFVREESVKSVIKNLTDSPLSVDVGSLRSQGYCDFDYFAEDFVGQSRNFT